MEKSGLTPILATSAEANNSETFSVFGVFSGK